jgi:hypothetical protein
MAAPGPYGRAAAHGFMVDPDEAAMSNMVADMAAMNLQFIQIVREGIPAGADNDPARARLDALANRANAYLTPVRLPITVKETRENCNP